MSYDIYVCDSNDEVIDLGFPHNIHGETYCEEETELYLNVTFNYRPFFLEALDSKNGIHYLNGLLCCLTYGKIAQAMKHCVTYHADDIKCSTDPWKPTWGNFFNLLTKLMNFSMLAPYGTWRIEN